MEVPGGHLNKTTVILYEVLGTALLTMIVNWSTAQKEMQPIAIGSCLFSCMMLFGTLSGGHFNPAVSLAILIKEGKENFRQNVSYFFMLIFG